MVIENPFCAGRVLAFPEEKSLDKCQQMLYLVHMENSNNIGLALKKTIDLMVGTGEAPDRIRAKTLLTIMYGANPTEEQLKSYRHSMHRKGGSTHRTQEKVAALIESAPVGTGDPFEGLV